MKANCGFCGKLCPGDQYEYPVDVCSEHKNHCQCYSCSSIIPLNESVTVLVDSDCGDCEVGPQPDVGYEQFCLGCYREQERSRYRKSKDKSCCRLCGVPLLKGNSIGVCGECRHWEIREG